MVIWFAFPSVIDLKVPVAHDWLWANTDVIDTIVAMGDVPSTKSIRLLFY